MHIEETHGIVVGAKEPAKERIYNDAVDKNVAALVVYTSGGEYFFDEAGENKVPDEEVANIFFKDALLFENGTYYRSVSFDGTTIRWTNSL